MQRQWAVLVRMDSTNNWYRGPKRFPSQEDAEEYGHNFYQQHSSCQAYLVVEAPESEDTKGHQ